MTGSIEVCGTIELEGGKPVEIVLQFASPVAAQARGFAQVGAGSLSNDSRGGCRFGGGRLLEDDEGINEALEVAKKVETVVLVVGLNNGAHCLYCLESFFNGYSIATDWESEGYDRTDMHLPRATNKLIQAILDLKKKTIIVIISGTPVAMPWVNSASTIVQSFYAGGEAGHGLADVLFGKVNPSSKLPLTFPIVSRFLY
jgi:beta-glucosidase